MNKNIFGIFIILLGLLIISGIIYVMFFSEQKVPLPINIQNTTENPPVQQQPVKTEPENNKIKVNLGNTSSPEHSELVRELDE